MTKNKKTPKFIHQFNHKLNLFQKNPLKKKKATQILNQNTNQDKQDIQATVKAERYKILALDFVIFLLIIVFFVRHFIQPISGQNNSAHQQISKVLYNLYLETYGKKNYLNIFLSLALISIISIFLSFEDLQIKQIGLIIIVSFISSLAVEAKLFISGAVIAGISGYLYLRLITIFSPKIQIHNSHQPKKLIH